MDNNTWIKQNTAMLVVHGIGSQLPLQTIDEFSRTLLAAYQNSNNHDDFTLSHKVAAKPRSSGQGVWFDNFLRISKKNSPYYLDIYEYYWANLTCEKANPKDIKQWIFKVILGAKNFYKRNAELGLKYKDKSVFFTKNGKFRVGLYKLVMWSVLCLLPILGYFLTKLGKFLGNKGLSELAQDISQSFSNLVGDVTVYNTMDPKLKAYESRKAILDGAVESVRYLVEAVNSQNRAEYDRVLIAGHSLGSQIAFDAINRLTHQITQNQLKRFNSQGEPDPDYGSKLNASQVLCGLITFGCPLDKIAFFLREQTKDQEYIRLQMLNDFHCFKQRDLLSDDEKKAMVYKLGKPFISIFDDIRWFNFYDNHDYVSGSLDYYQKLVNRDRKYKTAWYGFTHGWYWTDQGMFEEIIENFLKPQNPLQHV